MSLTLSSPSAMSGDVVVIAGNALYGMMFPCLAYDEGYPEHPCFASVLQLVDGHQPRISTAKFSVVFTQNTG